MSWPNNTEPDETNRDMEQENNDTMDIFEADPATRLRFARLQLIWAVASVLMALALGVAGYWYFCDGTIPAFLDTHGGRWAWLGAGALAGWLVLDQIPAAISDAGAALDDYRDARFTVLAHGHIDRHADLDAELDAARPAGLAHPSTATQANSHNEFRGEGN